MNTNPDRDDAKHPADGTGAQTRPEGEWGLLKTLLVVFVGVPAAIIALGALVLGFCLLAM